MAYDIGQPLVWPAVPDWSDSVTETLAWLTDVMQAPTGGRQARQLRAAPRRSFAFKAVVNDHLMRLANGFRFDIGVRQTLLPVYPDVVWLAEPLAALDVTIPCAVAGGYDFAAGGQALLWQDVDTWAVVAIASVGDDTLTLKDPLIDPWPVGTRLYPLRVCRFAEGPKQSRQSGAVGTLDVTATVDEPCDWPPAWPSDATYRDLPVLEWRNEESQDPTDQYARQTANSDEDTGPAFYYDVAGMPFRTQSQRFVLHGRNEHARFRSLLYALAGQAGRIWVPDWAASLKLSASSNGIHLTVANDAYGVFGRVQPGRRDLRIELHDGAVLYRRIVSSVASGDTETFTLDAALPAAIAPDAVRQINWLTLSSLASDTVKIDHQTDAAGVAICQLSWQAVLE